MLVSQPLCLQIYTIYSFTRKNKNKKNEVVLFVNIVNSVNNPNKSRIKLAPWCLQWFTLFTLFVVNSLKMGILKNIIFCNIIVDKKQLRLI